MTITKRVKSELFETSSDGQRQLIRIPPEPQQPRRLGAMLSRPPSALSGPVWSPTEHGKFLQALELYPSGPWKAVAAFVGSKTARQVMTHAQKYRQKIARRKRGLKICTGAIDVASPSGGELLAAVSPIANGDAQCESDTASVASSDDSALSISERDLQLFEADVALYPLLKELEGIGSLELDDCIVEELEPLEVGDSLCASISPEQAAQLEYALLGTQVTAGIAFD